MNHDPNVNKVELAAQELGQVLDELVLVGGCAVGLLISDPGSPPVRSTIDVDVIIEIAPATEYYKFCEKLKDLGFSERPTESVICRWSKASLVIDLMPVDATILGFTNSWYAGAIKHSMRQALPNGLYINLISAPYFIATKLESFLDRGNGDYLHHDIEDIINLINGRDSVCDEIANSESDVRTFLLEEFETLLADETFAEQLSWHLAQQKDRFNIVIERMRTIAGM